MKKLKVSVIICTMNEEKAIGKLIKEIPKEYELIIVDKSSDKTLDIAKKVGARVIKQKSKGKGNAMRMGVKAAKGDIVVFIDGDGTNPPREIPKLIKPILCNEANMVIGIRIPEKGAMKPLNKFGNWFFSTIASILYHPIKDLLTGMRALKKEDFLDMNLKSKGFEIETEIFIQAVKNNLIMQEVNTKYHKRAGETKLNMLGDGLKILKFLIKNKIK